MAHVSGDATSLAHQMENDLDSMVHGATAYENYLSELVDRRIYFKERDEGDEDVYEIRHLKDFQFQLIKIWCFKSMEDDNSIEYSASRELLDSGQVRDYLANCAKVEVVDIINSVAKLKKRFLGGLRLLVQAWPKNWTSQEMENKFSPNSSDPSTRLSAEDFQDAPEGFIDWLRHEGPYRILPFSKATLKLMTDTFRLPTSYPYDLTSEVAVPLRCNWIGGPPEEVTGDKPTINLGMILQTPKHDDDRVFVSSALSYDPSNSVTSGFLGFVTDGTANDNYFNIPSRWMESIIPTLTSRYFAPRASHPLLLPSIILHRYVAFCNVQFDTTRQSLENLRENIATLIRSARAKDEIINRYDNFSNRLQIHHARLVSEAYPFVSILGEACLRSIPIVREANRNSVIQAYRSKTDENEIKACVKQLGTVVNLYNQQQSKLLSHLELILQELTNTTQFLLQRSISEEAERSRLLQNSIAEEAERGSKVTVAISGITALFLPATAIATVFGMVEFFTVDTNDKLKVSPSWIVYWEITIPTTLCLIIAWLYWRITAHRDKELATASGPGTVADLGPPLGWPSHSSLDSGPGPGPGPGPDPGWRPMSRPSGMQSWWPKVASWESIRQYFKRGRLNGRSVYGADDDYKGGEDPNGKLERGDSYHETFLIKD